jgi:hypothetical protein
MIAAVAEVGVFRVTHEALPFGRVAGAPSISHRRLRVTRASAGCNAYSVASAGQASLS